MIPLFGSVLASTYLIRFISQKSKEKWKSSGNDSEHDKESNETNYDDEDQLEKAQEVETTEIAIAAIANQVF
jgi:hypothetical protein